tara:strand:+ start:5596 stop:6570 length:975 start_codon:yes stop_codon:yes gene_type:complete
MAIEFNPMQALNLILTKQQENERFKVQQALSLMDLSQRAKMSEAQFAQQKKIADISIAEKSLTMAENMSKQLDLSLAGNWLSSSGLGSYYKTQDMVGEQESPLDEMVSDLTKKKLFTNEEARKISTAMYNYYEGKDPSSVLNLIDDYDKADAAKIGKYGTKSQRKLYHAIDKISAGADLTELIKQKRQSSFISDNIDKERSEFLRGEFEIQEPISATGDIGMELSEFEKSFRAPSIQLQQTIENKKEELKLIEERTAFLEGRQDRTFQEQEELNRLPELIDRTREDLDRFKNEIIRRESIAPKKEDKKGPASAFTRPYSSTIFP